jgi:hypothetical protein
MEFVLRLMSGALGVSGVAIAVWTRWSIRRVYRRHGWTLLPPVWKRLTIAYEILACSAIALGLTVIDPSGAWAAVVRLLGAALFLGSFGLLI